jgi:hypothetical protein
MHAANAKPGLRFQIKITGKGVKIIVSNSTINGHIIGRNAYHMGIHYREGVNIAIG